MPAPESVVIAAAGMGSRLGHGIPKCLVEVGGRTLIEGQLDVLSEIPDIRIVVGYMEQAVIDAVSRVSRNVIFVRNPEFRSTTTQDSYTMGALGLDHQCLFLDADIVFDPVSLNAFLAVSACHPMLIGVTAAKTDNAVYAVTRAAPRGDMEVISFSLEASRYEWANIVSAPAGTFSRGRGAVFEALQTMLPAAAKEIVSFEIDTEQDLRRAERFVLNVLAETEEVATATDPKI